MAWLATSKSKAVLAQAVACLSRVADPNCSSRELQHFLQHHSMHTCKAPGNIENFQIVCSRHHVCNRKSSVLIYMHFIRIFKLLATGFRLQTFGDLVDASMTDMCEVGKPPRREQRPPRSRRSSANWARRRSDTSTGPSLIDLRLDALRAWCGPGDTRDRSRRRPPDAHDPRQEGPAQQDRERPADPALRRLGAGHRPQGLEDAAPVSVQHSAAHRPSRPRPAAADGGGASIRSVRPRYWQGTRRAARPDRPA